MFDQVFEASAFSKISEDVLPRNLDIATLADEREVLESNRLHVIQFVEWHRQGVVAT